MLDVSQAHELKLAFRREAWSNEEIKMLTEQKGLLRQVREVLLGRSEIKVLEHVVDFDKDPSVPEGWSILPDSEQLSNRVRGQMKFDQKKIGLHLDDRQKKGCLEGNELRKSLADVPAFGAQLLDFYLANPHLIPEEWKGKAIFFWGTIYRYPGGGLCVRYLCWNGGRWGWHCSWLGLGWFDDYPAAVLAS